MAKSKVDQALVKELARLLEENDLTELVWSEGERSIRVVRNTGTVTAASTLPAEPQHAESAPAPAADSDHPGAVTSPMVGTIYISPEPGADPFVTVGAHVTEGQTLLIVEAMKTMNPILSARAGTVTRILVADATPVEYGQILLIVE